MTNLAVSICGGGMLGIGPLVYMSMMEKDLGFHLASKSVAFAGTSTGAIIAAMLAEGYTAGEGLFMFKENLGDIFKKNPWYKRIFNWYMPKYDNSALKTLLQEHLSGKCYEWRKPIFLTAYAMNGKSVEKVWDKGDSVDKWEAVVSSTCAPTYFRPFAKDATEYVDGGIWTNNPVAVLNAGLNRSEYRGNVKILSFNTGMTRPNTESAHKTALGWGEYLLSECIGATSTSSDYMVRADIGNDRLFVASPVTDHKHQMDDISDKHVAEVEEIWIDYYNQTKPALIDWINKV